MRYGAEILDESPDCVPLDSMIHIDDSKIHEVNSELNDMLSAEITIEAKPINIEWLDKISITPGELQALEPFIEE